MVMSMVCYVVGLLGLLSVSGEVLKILINIEIMVLGLFLLMSYFFKGESSLEQLVFMVVVVGESCLGLLLLVLMVWFSGEDYLSVENVV